MSQLQEEREIILGNENVTFHDNALGVGATIYYNKDICVK